MIETRNGLLACDPFEEEPDTSTVQTTAFKPRDDKKGLMVSTVVYSDDDRDYPPGAKVWMAWKDRVWTEIQFRGRKLVLVSKGDIVFVQESDRAKQTGPCGSPYHGVFINCPYCPAR